MRNITFDRTHALSDNNLSLDWTSLGRMVRSRTLQAVALHFQGLAECDALVSPADSIDGDFAARAAFRIDGEEAP